MRRASGLLAVGVASIACAAACTADRHAPESVRTSAAQGSTSTPLAPRQSSVIDAPWTQAKPPANCPVTVGSPATVPPSVLEANDMPVPWAVHWFGDGTLWTRLPPTGVLPVEPGEAGQLSWTTKFPWWRTTPGQLTIRARLLGADAAARRRRGGRLHRPGSRGLCGDRIPALRPELVGPRMLAGHRRACRRLTDVHRLAATAAPRLSSRRHPWRASAWTEKSTGAGARDQRHLSTANETDGMGPFPGLATRGSHGLLRSWTSRCSWPAGKSSAANPRPA